jgi:hypothetical protein
LGRAKVKNKKFGGAYSNFKKIIRVFFKKIAKNNSACG